MAAEFLTIRNLTPRPIVLKVVERFAAREEPRPDLRNLTQSFTTLMNNITRSSDVGIIESGSEAFANDEVSIRIEPFKDMRTDVRAFVKSDKEKMRLIFEVNGEMHRIQIPIPTNESAMMKALVEKPQIQLTGIFVTPESYLSIFASSDPSRWMRELKDDTLTSSISIPGTHNSPTCYVAPPSVRCQAVGPREQLDNGVRFFDIRVQPQFPDDPTKDGLVLVHSAFPISFTGSKYFRDLVEEVESFLQRNPSETLIMSVKREGPGKHTDAQLSRILKDHYTKNQQGWYTEPRIPTLKEARGKIVLVRRFDLEDRLKDEWNGRGWGIDATGWADNTPHATCPSGHLCIQDFYEVLETENITKKIDYVHAHLGRAAEASYPFGALKAEGNTGHHPFYINFLSASNFWKVQTWPEKVAAKLNPATVDYLCRKHKSEKGDWSTGILVCDWVGLDGDWDLVRCIVGMNSRLIIR